MHGVEPTKVNFHSLIKAFEDMGMQAIWIDQSLAGWTDRAEPELPPTAIVHSLEDVTETVLNHYKGRRE